MFSFLTPSKGLLSLNCGEFCPTDNSDPQRVPVLENWATLEGCWASICVGCKSVWGSCVLAGMALYTTSVGAASGQKAPECLGLPAKAPVQHVVMGSEGKRKWDGPGVNHSAAGRPGLGGPPPSLGLGPILDDGVLLPRHRCLAPSPLCLRTPDQTGWKWGAGERPRAWLKGCLKC